MILNLGARAEMGNPSWTDNANQLETIACKDATLRTVPLRHWRVGKIARSLVEVEQTVFPKWQPVRASDVLIQRATRAATSRVPQAARPSPGNPSPCAPRPNPCPVRSPHWGADFESCHGPANEIAKGEADTCGRRSIFASLFWCLCVIPQRRCFPACVAAPARVRPIHQDEVLLHEPRSRLKRRLLELSLRGRITAYFAQPIERDNIDVVSYPYLHDIVPVRSSPQACGEPLAEPRTLTGQMPGGHCGGSLNHAPACGASGLSPFQTFAATLAPNRACRAPAALGAAGPPF
eukprot:scaffold71631_cov35-Tisochrysis_lutea.AAC.2